MEGRPISDLKVAELRKELEKRNKDKTGVKQVLLDRLKETLEKDGHDPQTYRFRDDDSVKTDLEISDHSPVNGDGLGAEKVGPITKRRSPSDDVLSDEYIISEHPLQKKITEETVPYVVQVGEQEEDLDYDLKYGNNDVPEVAGDSKDTQVRDEELDKHENKPESSVTTHQISESYRNLWISNLPKLVKAADLKQHFSKAGKVVSATVVMSTRTPGGCFGFIQMASAEEAASAARAYDLTEFGGCILRVEATERKAPIQSNKANDRVAGLNKLKTSMPDSRRTVSRPLVSRRRYIANRQRLLRRAAIRTAILREQRKRSEYLSANNRPHSIKKTPIRRPLYQFTRPNYRMSKDSLRSRGGLALASKHKSISQRQSSSRINTNHGTQSLLQRRLNYTVNRRLREPIRIHKSASVSHRSSKSYLPRVHRSSNICPENHRSCLSPPSRLIPLDTLTSKRNPTFRTNRPVERDIREPYRPVLPERKYHPQSPGRSHESSRYARNTQSSVYTGRNTDKSVYDSRSRQSHLMTRSEPRYTNYSNFDSRKMAVASRTDMYSEERYRTHDSHLSEVRRSQLRSNPPISRIRVEESKREYRAVSRSPPRSRDSTMMRPYPVSLNFNRHRTETSHRGRSPLMLQSTPHRPEIVEYEHRSEPRTNWQTERRSKVFSSPSQSWRPANNAFFLSPTYENRNTGRRYQ
ncbi:unnamed protein product [Schistosoma guineensis]|nr:unnamed protein product [Schistosoma guineensis]